MESTAVFGGLHHNYLLCPSRTASSLLIPSSSFSLFSNPSLYSSSSPSLKLQKRLPFASYNVHQPASPFSRDAVLSETFSRGESELADIDWDNLGFGCIPTDYMYIMKCAQGGNFSKGELQRFGNIELSPSAGVLNYGQGLFEGLKAYTKEDGNILLFRPEENAMRMRMGAERMCMPAPTVEQFVEAVKATVMANKRWVPPPGKGSLYIRPLLMGSGAVLGLAPAPEYTFLIYVSPVGNYFKEGVAPINLAVEHELHRATPGGTGGVKTIGNYAAVLKAQSAAKAKGYSDVLYLDCIHKKYLDEVSSCNIFVVKDNVISTPAITGTILPGITRKSIIDVAQSEGFKVEERLVAVDELLDADEVFCTGTAVVVSPVGSITYMSRRVCYGEGFGVVSQQLYHKLTRLQMGLIEDSMNWTLELN
ncbi:branched-chain-amino-acid aminotransferase 3 chloroplastic-like isoform X1 [Tripterygium wilfordii]|uniref:Branched-chain-amino-acid aminotransferase n=1 Tax=Tripterygium wilfordii TaxID=458696 RepID=A0A7J7DU88_TRIWF|nr:branched-chain amino acid aminotransferase 2, chloroplastic [Tripterygium wilfordii]KAF5749696.1 branched-chain-amino-acid aminotransferase 3 chloroplastic-like isoform X1 [Tripterygium wilfordii]